MSERSKGDVSSLLSSSSRVNNNAAGRVVKNPLLSASVTGLSFDDFPNKPLLLPAAPPVVHAPPPQPTNALIAGILNREPKTLVTVGQSSSIDDNETLDEINLNASSSDDSSVAAAAAANSANNSYLSAGDANANPLLDPPTNTDSLLSQAASSFGALPSVASNVFSTFSKRIYAGSQREATDEQQPQLDIQPTYIQQAAHLPPPAAVAPPPFYAAPLSTVGEAAPEPPKFYAPTELPNLSAAPAVPPTAGGQNTYRNTARKKIYAPIPGFSEHQQAAVQPAALPFATPPYPTQPAVATFEPPAPAPAPAPVQEERKSGGGLFSLTNLVPSGVLQNISGLVQSATGRGSESAPQAPPAAAYNAPNPGYFDISTSSGGNYFAPAQASTDYFAPTATAPPTVGGFFNPAAVAAPAAPPAVGSFFNPTEVSAPSGVGGYFNPLPVAAAPEAVAPPSAVVPPSAVSGPPAAVFLPSGVSGPPAVALLPTTSLPSAVVPPAVIAPSLAAAPPPVAALPPASTPFLAVAPPPAVAPAVSQSPFETVSQPLTVAAPEISSAAPVAYAGAPPAVTQSLFGAPPSTFGQPPLAAPPTAVSQPLSVTAQGVSSAGPPPVAQSLFGAPPPAVSQPFAVTAPPFAQPAPQLPPQLPPQVESVPSFGPPTGAAPAVPPPAAGQTSYRLQKGTRLYKSPLTAQETATPIGAFGQQAGFTASPFAPTSVAPTAAIFNPFGAPTTGVDLFAAQPTYPGHQPAPSIQQLPPSAFPPVPQQPFICSTAESTQGVPLYPPAAEQTITQPAPPKSEPPQPKLEPTSANPQPSQQVAPISASLFAPVPTQEVSLAASFVVEPAVPLYPPTASQTLAEQSTPKPEQNQEGPISASLFAPVSTQDLFASSAAETVPELSSYPESSTVPTQEVPLYPSSAVTTPPKLEPTQEVPPISASFFTTVPTQEVPLFSSSATDAAPELSLHQPSDPQLLAARVESKVDQTTPQQVPLFAAPPTATAFEAASQLLPSSTAETTQNLPYPPVSGLFTPQIPIEQLQAQISQQVPLFTAPPTSAAQEIGLFPSSTAESVSFFAPAQIETSTIPKTDSSATLQEVNKTEADATEPSTDFTESTPLFVPVPTAETTQQVELYPPVAATADISQETSDTLTTSSLFGAPQVTQEPVAPIGNVAPPSASDFFALPPQSIDATSAALTTQTTTTFFNRFAQTITTPLPQEVLPPPIGFVAPDANQLFEAQTIEPVLETEQVTALAPPPTAAKPTDSSAAPLANPFRRSSDAIAHPASAPSPLQSFFTPASNGGSDFNFFAAPTEAAQFPELPAQLNIAPPPLVQEPPPATTTDSNQVSGALGFEQLLSDTQQIVNSNANVYQNSSVNSFSGFFGGPSETPQLVQQQQPQIPASVAVSTAAPPSGNFFDHFAAAAPGQQEDQRIQNFFNNPPLQDQPAAPGELKYDLVHSGLPTKHFEGRSQTSASNQVEPPSSACSDFSTATKGTPQQQQQQTQQPQQVQQQQQSESNQAEDLQRLYQGELPEEILQQLRMASEKGQAIAPPADTVVYTPVLLHWFYKRSVDSKFVWTPFSHYDSALLETSLTSEESDSSSIVPVEGGRYDVNIKERTKTPVFWEGKAIEVRRCSWFYKGVDSKYVPYAEETAAALEAEYKRATETGEWLKKIPLGNGEQVTMHGPNVIVHFMPPSNADTWGGTVQSSSRPLVVKRDLNDFKIQQGESQRVDHLLFMVHGIGSACDLKMRNVEEVVDDFRIIAQQLVQSHYKNSTDMGLVGRVEVLPIEWHGHLHSEELGIDEKLKSITLESIPRLRNFTNDTLLDVLFYTSPKYCQKIMNTVADALNEVYLKYRMRHPEFNGGVSLAGHSLGSLILFDLLCHQEPLKESEEENKENPDQLPRKQQYQQGADQVQLPNNDKMLPKQVSYAMGMGVAGTGQPVINYTQLIFHPKKFFALGSPIGMFVTIRGIDKLGLDFRLPTCAGFYNIFHPFDPVAYRIEALVNPDMKGIRPVLIPHHKGRKRMHLELKETMTRVGADIKQRFMDTFKTTLDSVNFLATVTKVKKEAEESLEKEVFQKQTEDQDESSVATTSTHARQRTDSESTTTSDPEFIELDFPLGKLNDSKRVDYVLQEAPLEFINEYIFALSSHVCYWASEDTILFVMKEIYAGLGISTDSQVPQQSMTIERPSSRTNSVSQSLLPM
ncbi:mucin-2 isoform X2 [Drosophila sulfurigaster albostrigata]|uniref:mucin-2 isoform X2 n=1 Tax=Drosophila sulfurigaster albostrigata TaxID=89887 RepID=UPI002D21C6CB|nr:mucin-2 isoform X2 [Drosophila sulfurigaster albostrigata]